ncbi:GNAT family N-acetyltransferase [Microbacterium sp. SORGH_AS_0888]|uniref:GNAT family N-acetyltransferase n=1 Tax=Microbacterium sp. SORGH_AS_0888 TaxID=3041791 RepID=UPI00277E2BB3|nr:GNAT family protein [Microbacterium sp. SORGH_AS_0888]MDQ1131386.1 RimJ/RimL family protein N-acetyltransferase [Microbacterium sp. SORGH_AS_0888]
MSTPYAATPVLANDRVRLVALAPEHAEELATAVAEHELWRTWYTRIPSPDGMPAEIERRRALQDAGRMAAWAVIDPSSGRAVGMTTYMNLDPDNRRLEIGSTWLGVSAQGTGINPAAKLLLLERAFEELGCVAVEFRTHWHNHQSRAAIARLGAKQDGVLRNHTVMPDGTLRDTVVFSVIEGEWPAVRSGLEHRLRIR